MIEGQKLTFLVVDDNETVRLVMPRFLQRNFPGCKVVSAESFEEATVALHANPDINYIVSDFQIGREGESMGESVSCGTFLKEAVSYKKRADTGSKPLLGVAVHTSITLLHPSRDLVSYHSLSVKARQARDCGMPILELEKYDDWDEKCQKIKADIISRETVSQSVSR